MKEIENDRDFHMNEIERRQRSLIPMNIVVVIIALLAALSLLFAPIIGLDGTALSEYVSQTMDEQNDDSNENSTVDVASVTKSIVSILGSHISFSAIDLLEFGLNDSVEYVTDVAATALDEETDTLLIEVGLPVIMQSINEQNPDLEISEFEDPQIILDTFKGLSTTSDETEVDGIIESVADEIQKQLGSEVVTESVHAEIVNAIRDAYDQTIENSADGSFSVETCICILASQYLDIDNLSFADSGNHITAANNFTGPVADSGSTGEGTDSDGSTIYTSYDELVSGLLNSSNETTAQIRNVLDEASPYIVCVAAVIMAIAALWLVLAVFAFIRIFTKNKCFTMWYVKVFGFIPCLVFGILPLFGPILATALGVEMLGLLGILTSMTWISGACYVVLWLISILWAFPIKRKIRKENAILKGMA